MLLVLVSAALHATWNSLVKSGKDRYLDTAGVLLGSSAISSVALIFLRAPAPPCYSYIAASAALHIAYFSLIAATYDLADMSVVYPITRGAAPALSAVLTGLAVHEYPTPRGWLGAFLISAGVIAFTFQNHKSVDLRSNAIKLALLNALLIALYTLVDGVGVRRSGNAFSYTCWGFLIWGMGYVPAVILIRRREAIDHLRKKWKRGTVGGACSLAAYMIAMWAMTKSHIASIAALRETAILFGIGIASIRLKEPVTRVRVAACLLIVFGAIIIKMS